MYIHFDNVNLNSRSGPNSLAFQLAKRFIMLGHEIELIDGVDCDVSLIFIEPSGRRLAKRVVQRLDGIWSKPEDIDTKNARIKQLYHEADGVVFQSQFDCDYITSQWGHPTKIGLFRIISNGVEIEEVNRNDVPDGLRTLRESHEAVFVCSANWHRSKRLKECVELFLHLQRNYASSCLLVLGDHPDHLIAHKDVYYAGSLPHEVCLQAYAIADWMLHLAWFEHCPNVVVHALSQGCPVVCTSVGGTKELVRDFGCVLRESAKFDFKKPCDYDVPPSIDLSGVVLPQRTSLGEHACIDIARTAERYVELFERIT